MLVRRLIHFYYDDHHPIISREEVVDRYLAYMAQELKRGVRLNAMAKHLLTLFQDQPGAKIWRRYLSEHMNQPDQGIEVVQNALLFKQAA